MPNFNQVFNALSIFSCCPPLASHAQADHAYSPDTPARHVQADQPAKHLFGLIPLGRNSGHASTPTSSANQNTMRSTSKPTPKQELFMQKLNLNLENSAPPKETCISEANSRDHTEIGQIQPNDRPVPDLNVPALSLKEWNSASNSNDTAGKQAFAEKVHQALNQYGFLAITDHGVSPEELNNVYEVVEQFFALPQEAKLALYEQEWAGRRGYTPFKTEHAKDSTAPDLKEFFQMGPENNLYPEQLASLQPTIEGLVDKLHEQSKNILDAISIHLGLEEKCLSDIAIGGENILRLLHYPPLQDSTDGQSVRAGAHEDINLITLLVTATAKGLQLYIPVDTASSDDGSVSSDREYQWVNAVAPEGAIIVNVGDMLESLTNGHLKATTHRVVNPDVGDPDRERSRYSIPFFVHAHNDAPIGPHPDLLRQHNEEPQYPAMTSDEYRTQRLIEIGLIKDDSAKPVA